MNKLLVDTISSCLYFLFLVRARQEFRDILQLITANKTENVRFVF